MDTKSYFLFGESKQNCDRHFVNMKWNRSKPMKYLNRKKSFAKMWQDGVQSSPADFALVSSNYLKGCKNHILEKYATFYWLKSHSFGKYYYSNKISLTQVDYRYLIDVSIKIFSWFLSFAWHSWRKTAIAKGIFILQFDG